MASSASPAKADFDIASRCLREGNLEAGRRYLRPHFRGRPEALRERAASRAHRPRIGNHDQAAELIAQAILIDPDCAEAFADLAAVLRTLGRHEFADKALETAVAMGHRRAGPDATRRRRGRSRIAGGRCSWRSSSPTTIPMPPA